MKQVSLHSMVEVNQFGKLVAFVNTLPVVQAAIDHERQSINSINDEFEQEHGFSHFKEMHAISSWWIIDRATIDTSGVDTVKFNESFQHLKQNFHMYEDVDCETIWGNKFQKYHSCNTNVVADDKMLADMKLFYVAPMFHDVAADQWNKKKPIFDQTVKIRTQELINYLASNGFTLNLVESSGIPNQYFEMTFADDAEEQRFKEFCSTTFDIIFKM